MIDDWVRAEMLFYSTTNDYSDADRYERFALGCKLDEKAVDIGRVIKYLSDQIQGARKPLEILETASATGLTAVGITSELARAGINHVYTSLDIEQNLLHYARLRGRGDKFVRGDFERLPFACCAFDIYIMMGAEGYRPSGRFYPEV
ncbi:MAG: class I SAM-dependent methyltransferase, partial [Candidatus Sungiibacteriota bacterium]